MSKQERKEKKMENTLIVCSVAMMLLALGCRTPKPSASAKNAYVVTVGVENGFAGKCSGSKTDCSRMKSLLAPYAARQVSLVDKAATKQAVAAALADAVKNANLAIFYFSGHGTHTDAKDDKTEADGQDEYICCYDTVMSDNEIWAIVSKAKGRVHLIFDCCHSGTMYRTTPVNFARQAAVMKATSKVDGPVSLLCWSGCPDDKYSWGNSSGGFMTTALKKYFSKSLTYDKLWSKMEADKTVKRYEVIQRTKMGKDFGSKKVFQ